MPTGTGPLPSDDLLVAGVLAVFYLLPTLVALGRRSPATAGVVRVNLRYGWTGVGWLVALLAASTAPAGRRRR